MNDDIISVIVPIYNVEKYLDKCLTSIINQSYDNLDIILVNDGSTDNCLNICNKYKKKDNRITIIDKTNGGLSDARNAGISVAKGNYVAFIDSDDFIEKTYIEDLYNALYASKSNISVCSFDLIDDYNKLLNTEYVSDIDCEIISGKDLIGRVLTKTGYKYVVVWNKLYDMKYFKNLRFEKGKYYEDEFLNFKLFFDIPKVCLIKKPLYNYLQRNDSIVGSKMNKIKIQNGFELHHSRIDFFAKKNDKTLEIRSKILCCNWLLKVLALYPELLDSMMIITLHNYLKELLYELSCNNNVDLKLRIIYKIGLFNLNFLLFLRRRKGE